VGLRVKDQGRVLDMRNATIARSAGTARQGELYLHQGERSEREPPATGKASRTRASGRRACPLEARTTRAPGGANWNVTAMTDLTGRIIERYWYSPYGQLEAVVAAHPFDYDDDGDVDDDDYAVTTNGTCSGAATGDCRRLDANADGVVDSADQTIIAAYIATLDSDTELQRIPAATHSRRGNVFGHQGLVLDAELASYQNRFRHYHPRTMHFLQRDPEGHVDGPNLYCYLARNPTSLTDFSGTTARPAFCVQWCTEGDGLGCRRPGGGPFDHVDGLTSCDGEGNIVICFDPDKVGVTSHPDVNEKCVEAAMQTDSGKCLCRHENKHFADISGDGSGCGGKGDNKSKKCGGTPPRTPEQGPDCCDPCFGHRTEMRGWDTQVDCLKQKGQPQSVWGPVQDVANQHRQNLEKCQQKNEKPCGCA